MKYVDMCIQAINNLFNEEKIWLRNKIQTLGTAFVINMLTKEIGSPSAQEDVEFMQYNKISWAKLVVEHPEIQQLMENFLNGMTNFVNLEFSKNKSQIKNFLKVPRISSKHLF